MSNGKNFKMASNKSGMLWPDASTNLGPSLQCDLKKIQSQKVKFRNSCKGNLRRRKIGIGQNDFVTVTHFGQGMEQVRWQDDWNSFQTSHFFQCRKFLFFGGSVYLLVRNAMIFHLFTQPSHENYQNSESFKYKK